MARIALHYRRRLITPLALIAVGLTLLVGCIYIPLPRSLERPYTPDPKVLVGDRGSNRPVEPGVSRSTVLKVLGEPERWSDDGRVLGYHVRYKTGVWLVPLCFTGGRQRVDLGVRFEFDAGGVLQRYEFKEAEPRAYWFPGSYLSFPADDVELLLNAVGPVRKQDERFVPPELRTAVTRPALPAARPPESAEPAGIPDGRPYETR